MCPITTYKSQCMTTDMAPAALAKSRPERTTSYSALLLVVENWRWTAHSTVSLSSDCSRTLTSLAHWLDEPSIYIIHTIGSISSSSFVVNSTMKSAKACALITVLGRYWMSNSSSSIAHRTNRLVAFTLFIVFHSGLFVWTTMVCAWKYGLSFLAVVINAKASFSIGGYLPSTPWSARLV